MNRRFFRYLSIFLGAAILFGSIGPYDFRHLLSIFSNNVSSLSFFRLTPHRILHFFTFGLLSTCLSLSSERKYQRLSALGAVIAFGVLVETAEFLCSTNPFEFWDVRDDVLAACVGYALAEAYVVAVGAAQRRSNHFQDAAASLTSAKT